MNAQAAKSVMVEQPIASPKTQVTIVAIFEQIEDQRPEKGNLLAACIVNILSDGGKEREKLYQLLYFVLEGKCENIKKILLSLQ